MNIGPEPREVVLSPDGARAYVSTANSVVIVDIAEWIAGG
jgi:DNA-binding beta-propeller fold protein YncE